MTEEAHPTLPRVGLSALGQLPTKEIAMGRIIHKSGKKIRPKTAVKGKRYRCAKCRKRSPKPVKTPAPWYCPNCQGQQDAPESE